jgi:DNA-binding transcriptional LysR family regulator
MDINLARAFLEVLASGSFGAAAERLNLTQTAVSARSRRWRTNSAVGCSSATRQVRV